MAGLLDFLSTPEAALGLGLLSAGSQGKRFGEGLLGATQYASGVRDRQRQAQWDTEDRSLQEQYRKAQIGELERKAKADARQQAMLAQFMGMPAEGGDTSAQSTAARPAFGIADTGVVSAQPPSGQQAAGSRLAQIAKEYNLPIEALQADMLFNGGKKIAELVSTASKPNWQNVNGNLVNTNSPGFTGGFQPGMSTSANGQVTAWQPDGKGGLVVGAPTGALDTFRAYQGVQSDSKPIKVYNPATQREEYTSEGNLLRGGSGGGAPRGMPQAQPGVTGGGYSGGSRDNANSETLAMIDAELRNPNLRPGDVAALQREKQRLQAQSGMPQSGNYAAGPSALETANAAGEKVRSEGMARADVERDAAVKSEAKRGGQLTAGIDRAIELLEQNPTSSTTGTASDKVLGAFGMSTKSGDVSAQLSTLSGWLVSNVPRMEGPQSNVDVANYMTMAGAVGDSTKPISQRLAAAKEVKQLQGKYAALNSLSGAGGATGSWGDEKPQKREFSMLPSAKEYDGKRMKAPDGSVYRSAGGKWVKE